MKNSFVIAASILTLLSCTANINTDTPAEKNEENAENILVVTGDVSELTANTAVLTGMVSSSVVQSQDFKTGILISDKQDYTYESGQVITATELDSEFGFKVTAEDLKSAVTYYYKAFIFLNGTYIYGSEKSFTTPEISVTQVKITPSSLKMTVSQKTVLEVAVYPKDATDKSVVWSVDNASVADFLSGEDAIVALSSGTCTFRATASNGVYGECIVEVEEDSDKSDYNGHSYIDLGLSVKWAFCNIGAERYWLSGSYFAWGETEPKTEYTWENYKWGGPEYTYTYPTYSILLRGVTKYNCDPLRGETDGKTVLDSEDDPARVLWGGTWRLPTYDEYIELINTQNCKWTWTTVNNMKCWKVQSVKPGYTDACIYLPAAGAFKEEIVGLGKTGGYWLNSVVTDKNCYDKAQSLSFTNSYAYHEGRERYMGLSVRAVTP